MKTSTIRVLAVFATCMGVASVATAQLVMPPPAKNPEIDANIPKEAALPPATTQPVPPPEPVRARPARETVPNLPWKEWELDGEGKVLPLNEPLDLASLRRNPYVTPDMMSKIEAYLPMRKQSIRRVVIENLDLIERVDKGLFEQADFTKRESVSQVVQTTRPLNTVSLVNDLKNRQIIDERAHAFNGRIVNAYSRGVIGPAPADATDEDRAARTNLAIGVIYKSAVNEQLWTYNDLVLDAAKEFPQIKAGASEDDRRAAVKAELAKMDIDARKAFLRRVAGLE
ncbi:MAG: hypothetical protein KF864_05080 [Phycisphaeraceae bacterium]|nr:hypothetical protein [Phycisphaeraceae bacterium]